MAIVPKGVDLPNYADKESLLEALYFLCEMNEADDKPLAVEEDVVPDRYAEPVVSSAHIRG